MCECLSAPYLDSIPKFEVSLALVEIINVARHNNVLF